MSQAATLRVRSRQAMAAGSKSFAAASRLLDPVMREDAWHLYAWCRYCDDVIDGQVMGQDQSQVVDAAARLAELKATTAAALAGAPMAISAFAAFQSVALRHALPPRFAFDLLDGFAMDAEGTAYPSLAALLPYCYGVAGSVGLAMAWTMGVRERATLNRAVDLGIGFQLTNIARDLTDDARVGRLYAPAEWMAELGLTREDLAAARRPEAQAALARRLVAAAEPYYASALHGLAQLPWRRAWAIAAARRIYRAIGRQVVRRGAAAAGHRISLSTRTKLAHALAAGPEALAAIRRHRGTPGPARDGLYTHLPDEAALARALAGGVPGSA